MWVKNQNQNHNQNHHTSELPPPPQQQQYQPPTSPSSTSRPNLRSLLRIGSFSGNARRPSTISLLPESRYSVIGETTLEGEETLGNSIDEEDDELVDDEEEDFEEYDEDEEVED